MKTVCIYCASSELIRKSFFLATDELAKNLVAAGYQIAYGGGSRGLMGQLAESTLQSGGKIIGVIPRFMCEEEWNHNGLSELILVDTMHERKAMLAQMADAVVALPGGCGTMEELMEIITWKKLGIFTKPIVILNIEGYFDELLLMLKKAVSENFMRPEHQSMWQVVDRSDKVVEAITTALQWNSADRRWAVM
ncbi:MAG: TIGR00730 family Rossman fold protein [Bacteroidales bacterium]|jgi:uncharacterized protein (TIGR00730 family)|nr:TIGR00730 family Rossman fold protein [Bacteroidales bacterium]